MYVIVVTYNQSMDQPGKVAIPARGQPRPCSRLRIWSHDTGSAILIHVSCSFYRLRPNLVLTHEIPPASRDGVIVHLYIRSSGQSRVYEVTQLRTDGVHCRESAGTGSIVIKVVPVTGAAFSGIPTDQSFCVSFLGCPVCC